MNGAHRQYTIDVEKKERFNIKTILCETKMEQIHDINNHNNPKIANLRSRVYFEEWRQQMSYLNEREMHVKSETELELEQERERGGGEGAGRKSEKNGQRMHRYKIEIFL